MEYKLLEEQDINLMQEVLEDDNMIFKKKYLENFINDKHSFGFVAKNADRIVGFAYGYSLTRPDFKNMFYLHSIGFLNEYQGKGYGTKLMKYIVNYVKENGFSELFVITDKGNPRACHVYEKVGGKNDFENEIVYVYNFCAQDE